MEERWRSRRKIQETKEGEGESRRKRKKRKEVKRSVNVERSESAL
jgi:hypothetical protein